MLTARRRLLAVGAALALTTTACSTDDGSSGATNAQDVEGTEGPQARESAEPQNTEEPVGADDDGSGGDDPAQDASVPVEELEFATCEGEGFTIGYPASWNVAEGQDGRACGSFGPGQVAGAVDNDLSVPVQLFVDEGTSLEDAPDPPDPVVASEELTVDGQPAEMWEAVQEGEGGAPEGVQVTTYHVEIADGTLLTAVTSDLGDTDYARDREILRRMIDELRVGASS